jgi:hypothetical protein
MEQASSRPKLRNIPVPHEMVRCFLCGKPLVSPKGDLSDEAVGAATGGIIVLTCMEHHRLAEALLEDTVEGLRAALHHAKEQQTKTE